MKTIRQLIVDIENKGTCVKTKQQRKKGVTINHCFYNYKNDGYVIIESYAAGAFIPKQLKKWKG